MRKITKGMIKSSIESIKEYYKQENLQAVKESFNDLSSDLFNQKQYSEIVRVYDELCFQPGDDILDYNFELAFSLAELKRDEDAKWAYEYLLNDDKENSAILNNLSLIEKKLKNHKKAFDLIKKAFKLNPDDEKIKRNYEDLKSYFDEKKRKKDLFINAINFLNSETPFALKKLNEFINKIKNSKEFKNNLIPITNSQFKYYIGANEQIADSLKMQWIKNNYIIDTNKRNERNTRIYELNPYLEKELRGMAFKVINPDWIEAIDRFKIQELEKLNYFKNLKKIKKVKRLFKDILNRDYNELTLNYLFKNHKAVLILAGSFIETLLIYFLEKNKTKELKFIKNKKEVKIKLYDAVLNDLLTFLDQKKLLKKQVVNLGHISRLYRNFVHPGKELKESDEMNDAKLDLCYCSVSELIDNIIK